MYYFFKFLTHFLSRISLPALYRIGSTVGIIAWYILPNRRRVAIRNAEIIGCAEPEKVAKESFKNTFKSYLEISYIQNVNDDFIKKYVVCENRENYDELKGQPFVLFGGHIGSWDLVASVSAWYLDYKVLVVGRPTQNEALNKVMMSIRNSDHVAYLLDKGYLEQIPKYEAMGYMTGSLLDHNTMIRESVVAEFFGQLVPTIAGLPAVSARKNIPMLPMFLMRVDKGFKLVVGEPIYPNKDLKPKARIQDMCEKMNKSFEDIIRQYPEQWYLLHRRFKRAADTDGKVVDNRLYGYK